MGRLTERLWKLDKALYVADGRCVPNRGRRIAGVLVVVIAASVITRIALRNASPWAFLAVAGAALLFVVVYVVARRRRNRRLTGSPRRWAGEDL